jgi:hypothetical protein
MDPRLREDDGFIANKISYVIAAQAATHTTLTWAIKHVLRSTAQDTTIESPFPSGVQQWLT